MTLKRIKQDSAACEFTASSRTGSARGEVAIWGQAGGEAEQELRDMVQVVERNDLDRRMHVPVRDRDQPRRDAAAMDLQDVRVVGSRTTTGG